MDIFLKLHTKNCHHICQHILFNLKIKEIEILSNLNHPVINLYLKTFKSSIKYYSKVVNWQVDSFENAEILRFLPIESVLFEKECRTLNSELVYRKLLVESCVDWFTDEHQQDHEQEDTTNHFNKIKETDPNSHLFGLNILKLNQVNWLDITTKFSIETKNLITDLTLLNSSLDTCSKNIKSLIFKTKYYLKRPCWLKNGINEFYYSSKFTCSISVKLLIEDTNFQEGHERRKFYKELQDGKKEIRPFEIDENKIKFEDRFRNNSRTRHSLSLSSLRSIFLDDREQDAEESDKENYRRIIVSTKQPNNYSFYCPKNLILKIPIDHLKKSIENLPKNNVCREMHVILKYYDHNDHVKKNVRFAFVDLIIGAE